MATVANIGNVGAKDLQWGALYIALLMHVRVGCSYAPVLLILCIFSHLSATSAVNVNAAV